MKWWHLSKNKVPPYFINTSLQFWIAELQVLTTVIYGFLSGNWGHFPQVTQLVRLCTTSMLLFTRFPRIPRQRFQPLPCAWRLWMVHTTRRRVLCTRWALCPRGCFCFHITLYEWKELKTSCPHERWQRRLRHDQRIWESNWSSLTLRWNLNNRK